MEICQGTTLVIYARDREKDGKAVIHFLRQEMMIEHVSDAADFVSASQTLEDVVEKVCQVADHFIVLPSLMMKDDQALKRLIVCLVQKAEDSQKLLITLKENLSDVFVIFSSFVQMNEGKKSKFIWEQKLELSVSLGWVL